MPLRPWPRPGEWRLLLNAQLVRQSYRILRSQTPPFRMVADLQWILCAVHYGGV